MKFARKNLMLVLVLLVLTVSATAAQDSAMTNEDVVTMANAGLGDSLIVAKIRQASEVQFDLETDELLALKEQGVSEAVLEAMLERTTKSAEPAAPQAPVMPPGFAPASLNQVTLVGGDDEQALTFQRGEVAVTGFGPFNVRWLNFDGLYAGVRTEDPRPKVHVPSEIDPADANEYRLIRLELDEDDKMRSLKLSRKSAFRGSVSDYIHPDNDFIVEFRTAEVKDGVWQLQPSDDLEPGEYGVLTSLTLVYSFGVDEPSGGAERSADLDED